LRVLVGLNFGGATWVGPEALPVGGATLGQTTWGPDQLLRDLELRLGLVGRTEPLALRVAHWQARMATLTGRGRYYSRSFDVDPLGTAEALLRLRDALVEAGWQGQAFEDGGLRLDALHELEQLNHPPLPPGTADRLALVERTLGSVPRAVYSDLSFAEPIELWPSRWQSVFRTLERAGTTLTRFSTRLPGASAESDLGAIQGVLCGAIPSATPIPRGDGSLVHVTAETSWEAACAVAAVVAPLRPEDAVVIRDGERAALDGALLAHGLRTQGLVSATPWRSAAQVLPLALELSFEPKDPYHVLELLTLPVGPFQGRVGHELARVLADTPGIGGPRWEAAKSELGGDESRPERARHLAMVQEWLETRGVDPVAGASKSALLEVVARVRGWLLSRIAAGSGDVTLLSAAQHTSALASALDGDPRRTFSLAEMRKLVASVLSVGTAVDLATEQAGRLEHVASAAALWAPCRVVVWWAFNGRALPSDRLPWRQSELLALLRDGLVFPDPQLRLAERAAAARRAFACATERVILVSAGSAAGSPLGNHPLWDEIVSRADLDETSVSRLMVSSGELLDGRSERSALLTPPPLVSRASIDLPGGRSEWSPDCAIAPLDQFSYASLDALLGCPLRWVLRYRAGTYSGGHALPPLFQLSGSLGHRLVEVLHAQGAFEAEDAALRECALKVLTDLYEREGALLLRPGMTFERSQLERQLVRSVVELSRALRGARLRIVAVEHPIDVTHGTAKVEGRIDLVVERADGARAIIDMKWGIARYREQLASGQALQLALYAFAHASEHGASNLPDAAYFSLKQGKLLGLSSPILDQAEIVAGPSLADTWQRAERSLSRAARSIEARRVPVTGLRHSLPLLSALGVPDADHPSHFQYAERVACQYCGFDSLCGRRWEALS
jgi:ATP-dependent helicase/nuclease subunit B